MGRRHYVPMGRHHDIPIRRREDVPLRRLGDVPLRRRWVFHLRRTYDVTGTYRETLLQRRHNLLPGVYIQIKNLYGYKFVMPAKRSEMKRCSKWYRSTHTKQCKLFT